MQMIKKLKRLFIYCSLFIVHCSLIYACRSKGDKPAGYQQTEQTESKQSNDNSADYSNKERLIWQKPEMVITRLGDMANKTIVDLGAGSGFFSFRIIPKAKKVIALDIDKRFINFMDSLKKDLPRNLVDRFETRLVEPDNAHLKPGEANAVIIVNTYMYINDRVNYMHRLKTGISKGGTVLIVDYKENELPVGPSADIKLSMGTVQRELKQAGFTNIVSDDTSLKYQYIITAENEK